jgi:hypothetical protein
MHADQIQIPKKKQEWWTIHRDTLYCGTSWTVIFVWCPEVIGITTIFVWKKTLLMKGCRLKISSEQWSVSHCCSKMWFTCSWFGFN